MNVVTANENKEIIDRLDIEVIKRVDGQFSLKELLGHFVNLYFNKMIIDITSIENYKELDTIKELSKVIDPNRVILLLNDDSYVNSSVYMSNMIQSGFYNFTRNYEGIIFLYNTPNNFENVKHLILSEEEIKKETEIQNNLEQSFTIQEISQRKIIGLANLSIHAGATSLTNMMVRQLNNNGYNAIGIEMFRQDLMYYHDSNLSSCMNKNDLELKLKANPNVNAVIIDLNEFGEADKYCDEILYLVEPSYIKLTKMVKKNRNVFLEHKNDKIILNMSFVNDQEIPDFEYETKIKVFANIPPLNDRNKNLSEVNNLLKKLGFDIEY